ncbi:hypothetical protein VIGAN_08117100 [Vigna angularis var. angularis]|uniref:Uncharacterized protein n=1 Tax=Vigna angularis var. angularis TaxID=157739 RepID=A0A0S3SNW9_PHAAN|nr:hypothetical protein VIGAN_08117100 [Vigna angularis var. angularis]
MEPFASMELERMLGTNCRLNLVSELLKLGALVLLPCPQLPLPLPLFAAIEVNGGPERALWLELRVVDSHAHHHS